MNGTAGKNSKVDPSRPVKAGFADQRRILPLCIAHQGRNLSPKGPTSSGLRVESPCGVEEHIQALPDYARTPSKSWDACGESSMGRGLTGTTGYGAVSPAVRDCGVNPPEDPIRLLVYGKQSYGVHDHKAVGLAVGNRDQCIDSCYQLNLANSSEEFG